MIFLKEIKKTKQFLLSPLCLSCSSYFCEIHLFCEPCRKALKESGYFEFKFREQKSFEHVYLINWSTGVNTTDQLVYRLKGSNSVLAIKFYAKILAEGLIEKFSFKKIDLIVPIPGSRKSSVHSRIIAEVLSQALQIPMLDGLVKTADVQQKLLGAKERERQSLFVLREDFREYFTNLNFQSDDRGVSKILFVDDVLSTGSSFMHCASLFPQVKQKYIATLFYREKSHGVRQA